MKKLILSVLAVLALALPASAGDVSMNAKAAVTCTSLSASTYGAASLTTTQSVRILQISNTCDQPIFFSFTDDESAEFYLPAGATGVYDIADGFGAQTGGGYTGTIFVRKVSTTPSSGTLYIGAILN